MKPFRSYLNAKFWWWRTAKGPCCVLTGAKHTRRVELSLSPWTGELRAWRANGTGV